MGWSVVSSVYPVGLAVRVVFAVEDVVAAVVFGQLLDDVGLVVTPR
jgi:hypothetical protein